MQVVTLNHAAHLADLNRVHLVDLIERGDLFEDQLALGGLMNAEHPLAETFDALHDIPSALLQGLAVAVALVHVGLAYSAQLAGAVQGLLRLDEPVFERGIAHALEEVVTEVQPDLLLQLSLLEALCDAALNCAEWQIEQNEYSKDDQANPDVTGVKREVSIFSLELNLRGVCRAGDVDPRGQNRRQSIHDQEA